jgi:hypothetical protein
MRYALVLGTVLSLAVGGEAAAQRSVASTPVGSRVRITVPEVADGRDVKGGSRWTTGTLLSANWTHVSIKVDGQGEDSEYTVPFSAINDIQVSRGMARSGVAARRGLVRGGVVGTGIALLPLGFARLITTDGGDNNNDREQFEDEPRCDRSETACKIFEPTAANALRNGVVGAVVGGVLGYVVGARHRETWEPLRNPRFGVIVAPGGVAVRVAAGR